MLTDDERESSAEADRRRRILVVDDNLELAASLRDVLEIAGYDAVVATDSPGALAAASQFAPDVAILDIELGDIDGYELAAHLRTLPNLEHCHLIAVTGYGQEHALAQSRRAGFEQHFVKPIDVDRLCRVLSDLEP
jgi:CheY-like chemotaxis protein